MIRIGKNVQMSIVEAKNKNAASISFLIMSKTGVAIIDKA